MADVNLSKEAEMELLKKIGKAFVWVVDLTFSPGFLFVVGMAVFLAYIILGGLWK